MNSILSFAPLFSKGYPRDTENEIILKFPKFVVAPLKKNYLNKEKKLKL